MRAQLLSKARLAQSVINWGRIQNLQGTEKDLVSTDYLQLKERLALLCADRSQCRFAYVMGRKPDGMVFFFVDSESPKSPDYSPPGQAYTEASDTCRRVFVMGREVTEGPLADRWGTWISGFIPVLDPRTRECVAVFGMDVGYRDWAWQIAKQCMMPITVTFLIAGLLATLIVLHRRSLREKRHEEAAGAALRATEDRYRALFEGSADAVMVFAGMATILPQ